MTYPVLEVCAVSFTANQLLLPLARFLERHDIPVEFALNTRGLSSSLRGEFRINHISFKRNYNLLSHLIALVQIICLLRRRKYSLVHVHTPIASIVTRIACRIVGVPVICTAHGFPFHDRMHGLLKRSHVFLESLMLHFFTDHLFCQSREDAEFAVSSLNLPPYSVTWIGNGVDPTRFSPSVEQRQHRNEAQPLVIGIVGRLVEEKGYLELFTSFRELKRSFPELQLVVIGSFLDSDHHRNVSDQLFRLMEEFPDCVTHYPFLSEPEHIYRKMDVFCFPSWREGVPRSLIEAMMTGLPCVATHIRGSRELISHREDGLLVPVGNIPALTESLEFLIRDSNLRLVLGINAHIKAITHFSEHLSLQRQLPIIRKAIRSEKATQ